jgi:hypothetical protein
MAEHFNGMQSLSFPPAHEKGRHLGSDGLSAPLWSVPILGNAPILSLTSQGIIATQIRASQVAIWADRGAPRPMLFDNSNGPPA